MKIAIIGAGNVGSSLAFSLLIKGGIRAVSLIDINMDKAEGEVLDLAHGISFAEHIELKAEEFSGISDADIIVITAGRGRKPNETRLDLAKANVEIYKTILKEVKQYYNGRSLIIIVSNPVDILTYIVYKELGIPSSKIIGSGTVLDSSRFRYSLSREFNIDPRNIHAYIIGEHGESAVPVWSMANYGQIPILHHCPVCMGPCTESHRQKIFESVVNAGKEVIARKGATYYAVALSVTRILEAIINDDKSILTVSSYIEQFDGIKDVALSLPAVLDKEGIRELLPINLNEEEKALLSAGAVKIKNFLNEIGY